MTAEDKATSTQMSSYAGVKLVSHTKWQCFTSQKVRDDACPPFRPFCLKPMIASALFNKAKNCFAQFLLLVLLFIQLPFRFTYASKIWPTISSSEGVFCNENFWKFLVPLLLDNDIYCILTWKVSQVLLFWDVWPKLCFKVLFRRSCKLVHLKTLGRWKR